MTTPVWKSFSVRLDQPRKEELDELVKDYLKTSDLSKADVVYNLLKQGLSDYHPENLEIDPDEDRTIAEVLAEIKDGCPYISHDTDGFICLEKVHAKKKADPLGFSPSKVLALCRACANKKMQIQVDKQNELLNKAGAKQLKEFIKRMIQLKNQDFSIDVFLCMNESIDMKIQASADGQCLKCPDLPTDENQTVYIETHCKKRINRDGSIGCKSLVSFTTVSNLDESFFNQFQVTAPALENVTEVIVQPISRDSVEAEFKVVEEGDNDE